MMETKIEIRKRLLEQRNALSTEEVNEKSSALFERLCALKEYGNAKIVLAYMDYRNEIMTVEFIKRCMRNGKRVALPKVEVKNVMASSVSDKVLLVPDVALSVSDKVSLVPEYTLSVYEINEVERDTIPGFKGIPEPDSAGLNKLDPKEIDLAVIPGVAFDYDRHRVGYGAGFYDRFLPMLRPDCIKAGVAYSFQLVDKIPSGRYDMPMDIIVTDDENIKIIRSR